MQPRGHQHDYDEEATARCERALVTLLGDVGPWRERLYLVGGLAPRYLVGALPEGAAPHVGTADVDLVVGVALDDTPETYRTLHNNLRRAQFEQQQPSFAWSRSVDGVTVKVELLCETTEVPAGAIFSPKDGTGAKVSAFNVRGAMLSRDDFVEVELERDRLDEGGRSRVGLRVANILPYVVLKSFAFQDRHDNKDAYDLVYTLLNAAGGPRAAGTQAANSPVIDHEQVGDGLELLGQRFQDVDQDGPNAYAAFLTDAGDQAEVAAQRRQQAVATVRAFLDGLRASSA